MPDPPPRPWRTGCPALRRPDAAAHGRRPADRRRPRPPDLPRGATGLSTRGAPRLPHPPAPGFSARPLAASSPRAHSFFTHPPHGNATSRHLYRTEYCPDPHPIEKRLLPRPILTANRSVAGPATSSCPAGRTCDAFRYAVRTVPGIRRGVRSRSAPGHSPYRTDPVHDVRCCLSTVRRPAVLDTENPIPRGFVGRLDVTRFPCAEALAVPAFSEGGNDPDKVVEHAVTDGHFHPLDRSPVRHSKTFSVAGRKSSDDSAYVPYRGRETSTSNRRDKANVRRLPPA